MGQICPVKFGGFLCFKGDAATITAVNKDIKEIGTYED